MAGLVHRAQQTRKRIARIETRGHTNIARDTLGKGMFAFVEPPTVEGEAQGLEHIDGQGALARRRELAGQRRGRVGSLDFDGLVDETGELARQCFEYGVDIARGNARRKSVHQRVVGRQPPRLPEQRRLVAHQAHHFLQMGREQFEVIGLLGLDPIHLGARRGLGEARDERRRGRNRMVALAAHLVQIGERPILQLGGARLCALQQARHFRRGEQGVMLGLERRQLLATHIGAAARHHHRGIPAQQRQRTAKCMQTAKLLFQLLVGRDGHGYLVGDA